MFWNRLSMVTGALVLMAGTATLMAGTLETDCSSMSVKDLPIGYRTELCGPSNQVYSVRNNSDSPVVVRFSSALPFRKTSERRKPADPPDPSWLTIVPETITIAPHEEGIPTLRLAIPKDKRFANRNYELWLVVKTEGGRLGVGLVTRIRFSTVEAPPDAPDTPSDPAAGDEQKE